jgi:hypothetical protein
MARKRLAAEQIVTKLGQIEVLQAQGKMISVACKEASTTEQNYYRWRKEYGGWPARYFVPDVMRDYCMFEASSRRMGFGANKLKPNSNSKLRQLAHSQQCKLLSSLVTTNSEISQCFTLVVPEQTNKVLFWPKADIPKSPPEGCF